jgi:hypothetical protein
MIYGVGQHLGQPPALCLAASLKQSAFAPVSFAGTFECADPVTYLADALGC